MEQVMTRRPQIGEPGFEWQAGMWCRTRGGNVVRVTEVYKDGDFPVLTSAHTYCTTTGRYWGEGITDHRDLVKVVAWPKESRT